MNKKKSTLSIYIYNSIEDEWNFISSFNKSEHKKLIHDSNRFADCYLFANSLLPEFTLISPIAINPQVVEYFKQLTGSNCEVVVPIQKTPFTCDNVALDRSVFSHLVKKAKKMGSLTVYAYAMTSQVFVLKKKFEKAGVTVLLPEAMQEKFLWTVEHFGSKSGFRKSFTPLMPPGRIETNPTKIIDNATAFFTASPLGMVLKTDKGSAGQGVHILKKSKFDSVRKFRVQLKRIIKKEPQLLKHPIVYEEYINTRKERKCPFPSVECFIRQDGRIEFPYYCNMIVTPSGEFYGMEMHESVFTKKLKKNILEMSLSIAKTYRDAGYRGRFDIDMVNDGKQVYAGESNTRINGGTDTYLIAKKLVGRDVFTKRYVLSSYINLPKKIAPTFTTMRDMFKEYLFDKKTKTGLIINSESVIRNGGFSYILIGKNKFRTHFLYAKIKKILTNYK